MRWFKRLRCRLTSHAYGPAKKSDGYLAAWVAGFDVFIFTCQRCDSQLAKQQHHLATERGAVPTAD